MIAVVAIPVQLLLFFFLFFTGNVIDLAVKREDVHESLIYRSNLKRDMLKEFSRDNILREPIHFGIGGQDGKKVLKKVLEVV